MRFSVQNIFKNWEFSTSVDWVFLTRLFLSRLVRRKTLLARHTTRNAMFPFSFVMQQLSPFNRWFSSKRLCNKQRRRNTMTTIQYTRNSISDVVVKCSNFGTCVVSAYMPANVSRMSPFGPQTVHFEGFEVYAMKWNQNRV